MTSLDRLNADQLQAALSSALIGRRIVVLEQTGSTNDAILKVDAGKRNEGLVLFAEHQTAGRGQRGNRWESAVGKGLWFSILLRPQIQVKESWRLTVWAIEAVSEVIRAEFALESTIKVPNDVQLHGRKVAGVLVEMRAQPKARHVAVVGIGVNANQCRDDFPVELQDKAISLAIALGQRVDRQNFAAALLRNLDASYNQKFIDRDVVAEGDDLGLEITHVTLPRSTPAATTSAARPASHGTHAAKSPMV